MPESSSTSPSKHIDDQHSANQSTPESSKTTQSPIKVVAQLIKDTLTGQRPEKTKDLMKQKYIDLRLIDHNNKWINPLFAKISSNLLPDDYGEQKLKAFVNEIVANIETNSYLTFFLKKIEDLSFDKINSKYQSEGKKILPDVVAYALALENLTKAMVDNWRIIEACCDIWQKERKSTDLRKHMGLLDIAKLYSVEKPIRKGIEFHRSGKVSPNYLQTMIPINIIEVVLVDLFCGKWANARAGWTLAINRPSTKGRDPSSGNCKTRWAKDKKMILTSLPLPRQWADLYQVWNLAFISIFPNFPYAFAELLIPSVSGYQNGPNGFIYLRGLALYTHMHWNYLSHFDMIKRGERPMDWGQVELTKLWGKANRESANNYLRDVKQI